MMKKYNKPEIVTLALDMVDVIETSAEDLAAEELGKKLGKEAVVLRIEKQVTQMNDKWTW